MKENDDILLINEYYPSGLTKASVKRYYELNKKSILGYVEKLKTPALLFLINDAGEEIVKRRDSTGKIIITGRNYDGIFNGRVISAACELRTPTKNIVLDIDAKGSDINESEKIKFVDELFEKVSDLTTQGILSKSPLKLYMTASGYHLHCQYSRYLPPKKIGHYMQHYMDDFIKKNENSKIKLDFSTMRESACHVIPWALNRNGLMCADVTNNYKTVKRSDFKVRF